ncbi:hypothetical protein [Desulfoferrobacter suflitae]|uniref:hypothetical protein n=1 Tax=Desulfoferrobacter suflitae TaxID=2865782 RepID=UPI002164A9DE|nr:hypothetical protein [Desulfoferrobacter suflitae]MCK8601024.1 hypothetical protein [Desulfoferrobacter suflitae]
MMLRNCKFLLFVSLTLVCLIAFNARSVSAEDPGLEGWEESSEYNGHYNVNELDSFRGVFQEVIDITPLSGMAPGVGIIVEDQDGDLVKVHLGPKSFVKMDSVGLRKGDKVKVKGVWADIDGQEVFMASKVKNKSRGENVELKVRLTSDGTPFWTMTPEQLAKEMQPTPDE